MINRDKYDATMKQLLKKHLTGTIEPDERKPLYFFSCLYNAEELFAMIEDIVPDFNLESIVDLTSETDPEDQLIALLLIQVDDLYKPVR